MDIEDTDDNEVIDLKETLNDAETALREGLEQLVFVINTLLEQTGGNIHE
jgi:hypothetical protein